MAIPPWPRQGIYRYSYLSTYISISLSLYLSLYVSLHLYLSYILSYLILSYPILSYLILSYLILSYLSHWIINFGKERVNLHSKFTYPKGWTPRVPGEILLKESYIYIYIQAQHEKMFGYWHGFKPPHINFSTVWKSVIFFKAHVVGWWSLTPNLTSPDPRNPDR